MYWISGYPRFSNFGLGFITVFENLNITGSGLTGFDDLLKIGFRPVSGLEKLRQNRRFFGFG